MAAEQRAYHQDYIARIRYSNTLPPPPNPPKLLNIPNTGLAHGVYTSTTFANKLAREQPLNIEADAELGMPINLIGLPGVFDGDESGEEWKYYMKRRTNEADDRIAVMYGLDNPPAPHPHDKPLLRPLAMLGKATSMTSGVSFLRRTEYISSDQGGQMRIMDNKAKARARQDPLKRKRPGTEGDNDPKRILRAVTRGFDLAYPTDATETEQAIATARSKADLIAWDQPRNPLNPDLHVLDTYPVLPDPDAFTDSGFYILTKFVTNPTTKTDAYDTRLDVGLLRPMEPPAEITAHAEAMRQAHAADPSQPPPPLPKYDYEYFLPANGASTTSIKSKFNVNNPSREDPSLYDSENKETGKRYFRYARVRAYETYAQAGEADDYYGESVALALHDTSPPPSSSDSSTGDTSRLPKGAYFYPIFQRTSIRPRRMPGAGGQGGFSQGPQVAPEENKIDFLEVVVREPDEAERTQRDGHREALFRGGEVERGEGDMVGEEGGEEEGGLAVVDEE